MIIKVFNEKKIMHEQNKNKEKIFFKTIFRAEEYNN